MKTGLLTILLLTCWTLSFGQNMYQIYEDSVLNNQSFRLTSSNDFSTSSINNMMTSKFIFGGHISPEIKADNIQKDFNAMGGEFNQKIEYFNLNSLKNWSNVGLTFAISDNNFISSNYTPDLWNLAFYGNSNYLGDTLDLSYTHFQYLHFQKYEVGFYDKRTQSYVRFGLLTGNRSINYQLGKSLFHTASDGSSIDAQLFGEGFNTDSVSGYFDVNGYGASIEINHNFIFNKDPKNQQVVNFNLSNIGAIRWSKNTSYQIIDSAFNFNGLPYNNLTNFEDYTTDDLLDTLGVSVGQTTRVEALPIRISIQKIPNRLNTAKFQSILGFKAILLPDYRPLIYGGVYYKPIDNLGLSTRLIYGGFSGLKMGLTANFWSGNKFYIGVGTNDLVGIISEQHGYGKSFSLSIQANL